MSVKILMSVKRNEFGKHDIYQNKITKKKTSVPRHPHLDKNLCSLICKQLEIPKF
jgi:hypothetical protein